MIYKTPSGQEVPFSPPEDTMGMLRESPRSPQRMLPGNNSLRQQVDAGVVPGLAAAASMSHGAFLVNSRGQRITPRGEVYAQTGGESNRVMPNRASFSGSPGRGDEFIHIPTKTRVVVMKTGIGTSKSGKSMCLVQDRDGSRYKVPIDSLGPLD